MLIRHFHTEDDGQPQGGESSGAAELPAKVRASDLRAQLGSTVNEQDLMRLLEKQADLFNDNKRYREKLSKMQDVPKGARVLTADEAALFDAYAALGTPDALKGAQAAATEAQDKLAGLQRDATLRDVRDVTGYDLDILRDIGGAEWQYSIKDEGTEAEPQRVVYVKDGDTEQRIDQHPKVQRVLPALKPAAASQPTAPPYPRQSAGGGAPLNAGQAHIQRTYKQQGAK